MTTDNSSIFEMPQWDILEIASKICFQDYTNTIKNSVLETHVYFESIKAVDMKFDSLCTRIYKIIQGFTF